MGLIPIYVITNHPTPTEGRTEGQTICAVKDVHYSLGIVASIEFDPTLS